MKSPRKIKATSARYDRESVEFRFEAGGPIGLTDLATSFTAIDTIYSRFSKGGERLSVMELRSGSIIADLAPFLPLMNQILPYVGHVTALADFTRKMKKAIDGFLELDNPSTSMDEVASIAGELAEIMRPLAGRNGAEFSFAHIKYRSKTGERVVELEAQYESQQIDRAVINAEKIANLAAIPTSKIERDETEQNFLREVQMILDQANRGPAKAKGSTGDRGVIETVSDKALPVYFAEGINKLKDRMVRGTKNPLKFAYNVDVWVHREGGNAKAYTVTEVHKASAIVEPSSSERPKVKQQQRVRVTR